MTTATPFGLPIPEDTDPLSQVAAWVRALAAAIDGTVIAKELDEGVTNSTTLQNDDELMFDVENGKSYQFEIHGAFNCASSAVDARVGLTFPGGDMCASVVGQDPATSGTTIGSGQWLSVPEYVSGDLLAEVGVTAGSTPIRVNGTLLDVDVSGTVRFKWAQATASTPNTLYLKRGSYIKVREIQS